MASCGFGFAHLKPSDALGCGAGNLDEQGGVVLVDADGVVGGLDGQGPSGVGDSGLDPLPGNDERAATADPAFDARQFACPGRVVGRPGGRRGSVRVRLG
jgi:hypothetical protein